MWNRISSPQKEKEKDKPVKKTPPVSPSKPREKLHAGEVSSPYNIKREFVVDEDLDWILPHNEGPESIFEMGEELGAGAFGVVFKATQRSTGHTYAIKVLELKEEGDTFEKERKELELMKKCDCKHIVRYFGSIAYKNQLWIIMEYCQPGSLRDIMDALNTTLSEGQIAAVCAGVLIGLQHLHAAGIVHRDVKAASIFIITHHTILVDILIDNDGVPKIADLGVSTMLDKRRQPIRGELAGTLQYMAPEMNKAHDTKCDVWSLGITCMELWEGSPSTSPHYVTRKAPSFKHPKLVPPLLQEFTKTCLTEDPSKRPNPRDFTLLPFISKADSTSLKQLSEASIIMREHNKNLHAGLPNEDPNSTIKSTSKSSTKASTTSSTTSNQATAVVYDISNSKSSMVIHDDVDVTVMWSGSEYSKTTDDSTTSTSGATYPTLSVASNAPAADSASNAPVPSAPPATRSVLFQSPPSSIEQGNMAFPPNNQPASLQSNGSDRMVESEVKKELSSMRGEIAQLRGEMAKFSELMATVNTTLFNMLKTNKEP